MLNETGYIIYTAFVYFKVTLRVFDTTQSILKIYHKIGIVTLMFMNYLFYGFCQLMSSVNIIY